MAPLSACIVVAILAAQVYGIPTPGNERRQSTLPSFVTTYGEFSNPSIYKTCGKNNTLYNIPPKIY